MTKNVVAKSWVSILQSWADGTERTWLQNAFPTAALAFLPMRQIYPAPTGVTSVEPHQFAYFDHANNTAHGIQWQRRIGVSFGRWPFTYELVAGPPGMSFGAKAWNTDWDGRGDAAYKAGYGQLRWTPEAPISSSAPTTVSVNVYDLDGNILNISWGIYTSDDIANGGVHAFVNADTGSDSTGNGSYAEPWQTISHACGTNPTAAGPAPAGCVLIPMGATAPYIWPQDSTGQQGSFFSWNPNYKPASVIGIPGQTATFDNSETFVVVQGNGLTMQDITIENYNISVADFRAFTWNARSRITFQGIISNNGGFGTNASNNSSMFYVDAGSPSMGTYTFITGCEENNRQSGTGGANNVTLWEVYNLTEFCFEFNWANSPSSNIDYTCMLKSDLNYGCVRANLIQVGGAGGISFGYIQTPYSQGYNCEVRYNVGVNINNIFYLAGSFAYGSLDISRNSFVSPTGIVIGPAALLHNLESPCTSANNSVLFGLNVPVPTVNTSGGTLGPGTVYYGITAVGVTGETDAFNTGSYGSNEVSVTLTGEANAVTLYWWNPEPLGEGFHIWKGSSSGGETQYTTVSADATSFTDDGTATWTTGTPPTSNTAVSANRSIINSNVVQGTNVVLPTGATVTNDGNNIFVHSGQLDPVTGLLLTSNGGNYGAQLS